MTQRSQDTRPAQPDRALWPVGTAKSRFSEMVASAQSRPQTVTRNGKPIAVVVGMEEWNRKAERKGTLVDFFMNSPLRGAGIDLERIRDDPREIDL